jgi:biotin transport system substrate-specific component
LNLSVRDLTYSALLAALTGVLGYLVFPLPFSPVPVTGQTFAVMLAGIVLTTSQAALSMLVFLGLGIIGVPIFSGGTAGIGMLVGPKGGYLIGFLIGAVVISLLTSYWKENYLTTGLAAIIGGIIVIHLFGVGWLSYVNQLGLKEAFTAGSLPFIPGDLFKAVIATLTGRKISQQLAARR